MTGMRCQPLDAPCRLSTVVGLRHFHEVKSPVLFGNFKNVLMTRKSIFQDGRHARVEVVELAAVINLPFPHGISLRWCKGIEI
jgi:hypothetical protein